MSLQCLNVEGQTKKKDGKKARKRKYKRKKENKNIASFHQTFAIVFQSHFEKGAAFKEGVNCLSFQPRKGLASRGSAGATRGAWIEEGAWQEARLLSRPLPFRVVAGRVSTGEAAGPRRVQVPLPLRH